MARPCHQHFAFSSICLTRPRSFHLPRGKEGRADAILVPLVLFRYSLDLDCERFGTILDFARTISHLLETNRSEDIGPRLADVLLVIWRSVKLTLAVRWHSTGGKEKDEGESDGEKAGLRHFAVRIFQYILCTGCGNTPFGYLASLWAARKHKI